MAIDKQKKQRVTKNYKTHEKDSGSAEYQIALFTEKIKNLTSHLKENPKDKHSRKGLLGMVQQRKKLLQFLKKRNEEKYLEITKKLKIKS